ncbi:hypothetical protein E3O44_17370 [Cryobacterium algoricola]|uniref:DUF4179 domain-containing protein n=1 Tax=Cryobacterium algoricola TaxID=1259183 RepID=A0ABY2I7G8_9MICO|nr:hypothetical protein [Cryobacterium algoricola]TFB83641.1 hypothetical protein E3O44_17370 [Cryobacterium algoricola]
MTSEPGIRHPHPEEPPVGAELDAFVAEMKAEVLTRIGRRPRKRFGLGRGGLVAILVTLLGLGTVAGTAVATGVLNSGQSSSGPTTIALTVPDFPATHLRVTFTTLTEGSYSLTVPGVVGAEITMKHGASGGSMAQTAEFPLLDASVPRVLSITATPGGRYTVDSSYANRGPADYPNNDRGQTFGTPADGATNTPDLLFAVGDDDQGQPVQGYVLMTELTVPTGLSAASWYDWVITFRASYPDGKPLPLYSSDGTTVLGTFRLYH